MSVSSELRKAWDDADHGDCGGFGRCETAVTNAIAENERLREALADAVGAIEESIKANQRGISTDWSGLLPSLKAALSGDGVQS